MIEIRDLSFQIGEFSLRDINFTVEDNEYFVILGPSGSGKTVLMECLAGIYKMKKGKILIDQVDVSRCAPEQRKIGYVPQDYVLFPFLNVRENITFGLKRSKYDTNEIQRRLLSLADLLGIRPLLDRDPRSLSGGEKQRVALARALAPSPRALLLDEPLSSLDMQTSKYLRSELHRIHHELRITTIHITHNHDEAEELADHMAVMHNGMIEQIGNPQDIFFSPETIAVSDFMGSLNILDCDTCRQLVPGLAEVDCGGMHIVVPNEEGDIQKISIAPRDVYISDVLPPRPSINRYTGVITAIDLNATTAKLMVKIGNNDFKVELLPELAKEMGLIIGKEIYLILRLGRLKVLNKKDNVVTSLFVSARL
jgi:ABC-type Fe3+/spermidine/putrescine transport system ATPase subunit